MNGTCISHGCGNFIWNLKDINHLGNLGVDGKMVLKLGCGDAEGFI
jgi:hypothetical protein